MRRSSTFGGTFEKSGLFARVNVLTIPGLPGIEGENKSLFSFPIPNRD